MGGAREAHAIVTGLSQAGMHVIASLPEPERGVEPMAVPTRTGAFTSKQDFSDWMAGQGVIRVIDASHSFDADLSAMVFEACRAANLPYLRILRAAWVAVEGDQWVDVMSVAQAAESVPPTCRLFSNTGWLSLPHYAGFKGEQVFLRQSHPVLNQSPYDFVTLIPDDPPFSVEHEIGVFQNLRITHLICRNVGGEASATKLIAARRLELPVYMVARRALPAGCPHVETVKEVIDWAVAE